MGNVAYILIALLALIVIAIITTITIVGFKKKASRQNLLAAQDSVNSTVAIKKKSKLKTNFIIAVSIVAVMIVGAVVYFALNQKEDISKYYGTYECQVQQGNATTTYRIVLGVNIGVVQPNHQVPDMLTGTYSASSTNVAFSFEYSISYSIKNSKITISYNQGNLISGTFSNYETLIVGSIGTQRDLVFVKIA